MKPSIQLTNVEVEWFTTENYDGFLPVQVAPIQVKHFQGATKTRLHPTGGRKIDLKI